MNNLEDNINLDLCVKELLITNRIFWLQPRRKRVLLIYNLIVWNKMLKIKSNKIVVTGWYPPKSRIFYKAINLKYCYNRWLSARKIRWSHTSENK